MNKLEVRIYLLNDMREVFYTLPKCGAGGALHIMLDDGNLRDSDLIFCLKHLSKEENEIQRNLGTAIIHELMMLSPAQRRLWWEYMDIKEIEAAKNKKLVFSDEGYEVI